MLLQFSKQIEVDLVFHVEILVIREGMLVAAASRWACSMPLSMLLLDFLSHLRPLGGSEMLLENLFSILVSTSLGLFLTFIVREIRS